MKKCWTCKIEKPIEDFGNRKSSSDGKQGYCKNCSKEKDKDHYANSEKRKKSIRENSDFRINRARKYIIDFLSSHPCVDCSESDIVVLEFDHIIKKDFSISLLIKQGATLEKIEREIQKCQVRCANCHKRRTSQQFNWYKRSSSIHGDALTS